MGGAPRARCRGDQYVPDPENDHMSRIQATVDGAIIALGALILLTLFALVRLLSGGGSDEVAAVLDSTELVGDIDPESPQEPSARSIDDVEVAERSTGAFPAPIGPTDETGDGSGTTSLPLDTGPDTGTADSDTTDGDTTDSGEPDDGQAPPADEPDDPPATTAPPEDEPSDDPDDGESGSNPNDDADPRTPEDPAGPDLDGSDPEDEDPNESKPDNENSGNENSGNENSGDEPANTAPSVFLTWSGYTLGGLTGQTTNPVTFIASDPDGDPLTFTATGMPPGMTIDPAPSSGLSPAHALARSRSP